MRIANLDSVRGIAAFLVIINHLKNIALPWDYSNWLIDYTPVHWVMAGRQAVLLFFVLSGFVLALPFLEASRPGYLSYAVRRFCRIYLPYFAVTCLAAFLFLTFGVSNSDIFVYDTDWKNADVPGMLSDHFLMTGLRDSAYLNHPAWSLIIEMRVSLLIPILVWLVLKGRVLALIAACIVSVVAIKLYVRYDNDSDFFTALTIPGTALLTVYYMQFFVMGVFTAVFMPQLKILMLKIPVLVHWGGGGGFYLFSSVCFSYKILYCF